MGLDIDKILQAPIEKIEQKELERFQEIGILSKNLQFWETARTVEPYWIEKCKYEEQIFFIIATGAFPHPPRKGQRDRKSVV